MTILNIETSTSCCSVAITVDGQAVASVANLQGANHASELPVFIEQMLQTAHQEGWEIEAVALSQGPGSYTGLRIGASMAKGLCYGRNIPLIPVDTLQVLCVAATHHIQSQGKTIPDHALLCPMLDARRMEVYTALYNHQAVRTTEIEAKIIDPTSYQELLDQQTIYFFGNGSNKCKDVIGSDHAHFIDSIVPQAQYMGVLAEQNAPLDIKQIAYYEPFYLKEFVAAPSHVKGLETK